MKQIELTKGFIALVDDSDFEHLSKFKWSIDGSGYPQRATIIDGKKRPIRMHREILQLSGPEMADHKDGDRLNNQRNNLRRSTKAENGRNRGKNKNNTSGYKGVSFNKNENKFQAHITVNRKHIFLGQSNDVIEVAKMYDAGAIKYHGEFATTNF